MRSGGCSRPTSRLTEHRTMVSAKRSTFATRTKMASNSTGIVPGSGGPARAMGNSPCSRSRWTWETCSRSPTRPPPVASVDHLPRHPLVHHRGVVDEGSKDRRGLLHVFRLDTVKDVHVRMMRPRVVVEPVLDELETRQANVIERDVVRGTGVVGSDGSRA